MFTWSTGSGFGGGGARDPFGRFRTGWQSRATVFPRWGLPLLMLAALPGLVIALLSIVLLGASLLALLLLTLPVYKLIGWVAGIGVRRPQDAAEPTLLSPGSKPVEVRVTDG